MKDIVLKTIAKPPLRVGLTVAAFNRWLLVSVAVAVLCLIKKSFILALLFGVLYYFYMLRQSMKNPYFMEESSALKAAGKTTNIHSVKGNYYSA